MIESFSKNNISLRDQLKISLMRHEMQLNMIPSTDMKEWLTNEEPSIFIPRLSLNVQCPAFFLLKEPMELMKIITKMEPKNSL